MNQKIILQTDQLGKYFYEPEKFMALKDISLTVKQGEFTALTGKSGSGKSTLLYVLSTMDTDYQGKLIIDGTLVTGKKQNELALLRNEKIGFVFQFHYLLNEFNCLQNVMIPAVRLGCYSRKEIEHRAYEKLSLMGLKDLALRPASKLSGGQQQRVSIARALINDPLIIMGDEPTGNLDSKNTDIVFEVFQQLSQEFNQTIITVTHDNDFAAKADRIIEMKDGKIY
ncbi:ABC transporter ATP-binding protein [Flavobacterium procerum]|uniref:ABC transporter ATP-binding protein n=1 Tax=Flavobacterium procerum TaxID=1455569 RepID=A0ABV6BUX8_9FLAO